MSTKANDERARQARRALGTIPEELAALNEMSHPDLCAKYLEVFGQPTRSRNKEFLRKKIAYRVQEIVEQRQLSEKAKADLARIATEAPVTLKPTKSRRKPPEAPAAAEPAQPAKDRDPRLPPAGTVLKKVFKGVEHEVKVLDEGFEFRGEHYRSLSKIAGRITGTNWNGFLWFGLTSRTSAKEAQP